MKKLLLAAALLIAVPTSTTWAVEPNVVGAAALSQFDVTSLTNSQATEMGLRTYRVNVAYTNGTPSITFGSTTASITSVKSFLIPYKMKDGSWRLKFAVQIVLDAADGSVDYAITGVTAANNLDHQVLAGAVGTGAVAVSYRAATNHFEVRGASGTDHRVSGDVELTSKPTWAD